MLKEFVKKHPKLMSFPTRMANYLNRKNKLLVGRENKLVMGTVWLKGLRIYCNGTNNEIIISDKCKVSRSAIVINGSNNRVFLGEHVYVNTSKLTLIGNGNEIIIGAGTTINGGGELAALEGNKVIIGEECMISTSVEFRSGDSHIIYDMDGNRINPSKSIRIGNHVWIGVKAMCLKGTEIADGSIVGAMSLVTGKFSENNCVIAGVPAKIVKTGCRWER